METGVLGKKIFFLYPPPVLTQVVDELAMQEFEVYLSKDHEKLRRAIPSFPDAIVFPNLDDGLDEEGWLAFVKQLRAEAPLVGIGVITLNEDPELRERYLMGLQVQCGFIILKIGAAKTAEILAKTLEANEARGRRKFVRAACQKGVGQCALDHDGSILRAELTDLSSAGMAICFENSVEFPIGTVLRDMALTIKSQRLSASGVVVARRAEGEAGLPVHVIMFDPGSLDEARRQKLKTLVFRINQATMDLVLERA
jgi:hypothetical protein